MPEDLLYKREIMPIVRSFATARNPSELRKAVEELYAAYPEVTKEYLEDPQAPGHRFPGEEKKHEGGSPHFGYKQGKDGKHAPQSENDKFNPVIKPDPYLKRLAFLAKWFGDRKMPAVAPSDRVVQLKALANLRKALTEETKAPVSAPAPQPAAMQQERRLCPRCGGAACYCPDGGGQAGKSADGSAGEGSEAQKGPAVVEDRKDFVPQSEPDRPLKGAGK